MYGHQYSFHWENPRVNIKSEDSNSCLVLSSEDPFPLYTPTKLFLLSSKFLARLAVNNLTVSGIWSINLLRSFWNPNLVVKQSEKIDGFLHHTFLENGIGYVIQYLF